jgi:GNAT superfamily N-acetyltransferase
MKPGSRELNIELEIDNSQRIPVPGGEVTIFSEVLADSGTEVETLKYKDDDIEIYAFFLRGKDGSDRGYASFRRKKDDEFATMDINSVLLKKISDNEDILPEKTRSSIKKTSTLNAIEIYPEYQKKGFGKSLFEYSLRQLYFKNNIKRVNVYNDRTVFSSGDISGPSFYEQYPSKRSGINVVIDLEKALRIVDPDEVGEEDSEE